MKASVAIRNFFNSGPVCSAYCSYPPVSVNEIKEFKDSCTFEEYQEYGRQACELIGTEFEEN